MESNISFKKGSEWRKWDLHIHSDAGSVDQIIRRIIDNEISVYSITDHCSVDKIDEHAKQSELKRKEGVEIYFLPGIELRTDKGKKSVHLIGVFPFRDADGNRIDSYYLKQNLLSKIDCSDTDILNAGKAVLSDGKTQNEYIERGRLEIIVNFEKAAEKISQLGGITIVHAGEKSSGIETEMKHAKTEDSYDLLNSLGHTKRDLMKKHIDICEISNWNASNLKEKAFYLETFGKSSIISSDSHVLADIGKKYSWIKADPTLEGLKQIIYEPDIRVALQEKPILYLFPRILSIKLKGWKEYTNQKDKDEFPPINLTEELCFSPNLTNIIGPRGSGKTVLVELLSFIFDKNQKEVKKYEKVPLIQYLSKRFPKLGIEIAYQLGENTPQILERRVVEHQDPFYTSPILIEYWQQGKIEQIADIKERLDEYLRGKIESALLVKLSSKIDEIKKELNALRDKYITKIEIEIENKKLLIEKKQIEEYFDKLKSAEYKVIVKNIKKNRESIQLISSLLANIKQVIEAIKGVASNINAIVLPEEEKILDLFKESDSIAIEIKDYYAFSKANFRKTILKYEAIIQKISESKKNNSLIEEEKELKREFIAYCEKNGINITQAEYEKKTKRLNLLNEQLRTLESKTKEYETIKEKHKDLVKQLKDNYEGWKNENARINEEFNNVYSKSNIKIKWQDPKLMLTKWIKEQFIESDSVAKHIIKKYFNTPSPVREDFIGDIITELVEVRKYPIEKIIDCLRNKKLPQVVESIGKGENLGWYFQRDETQLLRDDLIMRLEEYSEKTINLIQYKGKVLGKDSMSFGERCGTVVELIVQSGDHPLIIDQPEEHLDSIFITERVIEIIRTQKLNRQIIICTHNANIVVLGDSELVTVLNVHKDGTDSCQGSIENPVVKKLIYDVLEGGPKAFMKREQKYGFNN